VTQRQRSTAAQRIATQHRHAIHLGRPAARPLPKAAARCQSDADTAKRPVTPGDAAQARIFERMLQAEISQLRSRVLPIGVRQIRPAAAGKRPPAQSAEASARVRELNQLLEALQDRFGNSAERRCVAPRDHAIEVERHTIVALN